MKTLILTDEEHELLSDIFCDWLDWQKDRHNACSSMLSMIDGLMSDDDVKGEISESIVQRLQETKDAKQKSEQTISTGESIVLKLKTLSTAN